MGDNWAMGLDINTIEDELQLHELIDKCPDIDERKRIRERLKYVMAKHRAEREEKIRLREEDRENALKKRVQEADEQKKRTLAMYDQMAKSSPAGAPKQMNIGIYRNGENGADGLVGGVNKVDLVEEGLRRRVREAEERKAKTLAAYDKAAKAGPAGTARFVDFDEVNQDDAKKQQANKPLSPKERFQQMDAVAASKLPKSPGSPGIGSPAKGNLVARSPTAIKDMLLQWVKSKTRGYDKINITNFSSSWCDGMAFCALIHHFYPEAFDYNSLDPKNRRYNFDLAFRVAEDLGDVCPLLEVDDMIMMKDKPDWKCVFTYVQSIYRRFRNTD